MKIFTYPDEILKKKAKPIEKIDDNIKKLVKNMIETLYESDGVGLAAPQVGKSIQLIIVNPDCEPGKETVYINPEIIKRKGREVGEEGCLSVPGVYGEVNRAKWIRFNATLLDGETVTLEAKDFEARVIQHEMDHLKGVLFVEKVLPIEEIRIKRELEQLKLLKSVF